MKRARILSILFLFVSFLPVYAAPPQAVVLPQGVERVTSVEGITEYRLQNGLRVLLFPDPSKATITVNITYLVGSMAAYPKGDIRYVPTVDEQVEQIRSVTLDQLKQFHAGFYGASNSELTVIGDFNPDEVQTIVESQLATWRSPKAYTRIKNPYRKTESVNQSFETPDKANAFFLAGMPINIRDTDADYPAMLLGNYILGSGINSRLFARIRGKEGLSYGISSSFGVAPEEDNATFLTNAISAPENASKVEASFRDEVALILKDGFPPAEVTAAKDSWTQAQQVSRAQDRELVGRLGSLTVYNRTMAWDADLQKKIQALTPQQIVEAMRRHIDVSAMTFMKAGDFKKAAAKQ